jgi:biotin transport system substrate-specific component
MRQRVRLSIFVGLFAALTAVGAFIRVPVGPVPLTLQTLLVYSAGLFLGPAGGALSQLTYVTLGLVGLPIFTGGGGIAYVFSPTFGYLIGFIPAAGVSGWFARRGGYILPAVGVLFSLIVVYLFGVPYLYAVMHLVLKKEIALVTAVKIGFLVPVVGDTGKAAVALGVFYSARTRLGLPLGKT